MFVLDVDMYISISDGPMSTHQLAVIGEGVVFVVVLLLPHDRVGGPEHEVIAHQLVQPPHARHSVVYACTAVDRTTPQSDTVMRNANADDMGQRVCEAANTQITRRTAEWIRWISIYLYIYIR
jgi:hypothetical protein